MNLFELMQIFSIAGQKIDSLWEFFVTVHIAIFSGLFLYKHMKKDQLVISLFSYGLFSIINLRAKIQEYELYQSLLQDIKEINFNENVNNISNFIGNYDVSDRYMVTYFVHFFAFMVLLYLLFRSLSMSSS